MSLLYDIFVRGIAPLLLYGALIKFIQYLVSNRSGNVWKHAGAVTSSVMCLIFIGVMFTILLVQQYSSEHIPEDSILVGAAPKTQFSRSFWEVRSGNVVSLPLYVKDNREISLKMNFDNTNFIFKYMAGSTTHLLTVPKKSVVIFKNENVDKLITDTINLSKPVNRFYECILPLKFSTDRDVKIYSYEVTRKRPNFILLIYGLAFSILPIGITGYVIYRIYKT